MNGQSPVSSSEILGELTGGLFCSLVLVFAIWKCWRNVRRPGTNRKCALALLFFFLTVSIPAGAVTASWFLRTPPPAGILSVLMGLGMFGLWLAAIVLAVIGLVEMSLKPGVWDYGRNQAIWALALCVILGALAVKSMHRKSGTVAFGTIEPGQLLRFEDEKFEFLAPGRPWVAVDPAKINREARLAFRRSGPDAIFLVIADKTGNRAEFSTEKCAAISKERIQTLARGTMRIINEKPLELSGVTGEFDELAARLGPNPVYYQLWCAVTNGVGYEMVGWGLDENRTLMAEEFQTQFHGFRQIDPNQAATMQLGGK